MGYADPNQLGSGLRQRLYSRAFIIGNTVSPTDRFVYLVLDIQSGDTAIRQGILDRLANLGGDYARYQKGNVAVTGTHSHSGPGGWLNYLLPQITSKGFNRESYQAIVDGAILSIQRAHENLTPGHISVGTIALEDASVNRSPFSYLANPKEERQEYEHDVEKSMTMLKFEREEDGKAMGVLTWFSVHGTSLYGNNTLVTGDNKGVAAYLFEKNVTGQTSVADGFVAGFSQASVGDTTPNVLGAYCEDGSGMCRFNDSTCAGKAQGCHGRGPMWQEADQGTKSCYEIGRRQFLAARTLFSNTTDKLTRIGGSQVSYLHTYVNLTNYTFVSPLNSSRTVRTCAASLGHGFAGGTTDGPGAFDFTQHTNNTNPDSPSLKNPLWAIARDFVHSPSEDQIKCQSPKPILLDVGPATRPYAWTPDIVDIQLLRAGPLIIIVSPGEATTMSGRRWKKAVTLAAATVLQIEDPVVVLGGPANSYTHYIATEEEYSVQRYEGASTLYGPHTLEAYINLTLTYLPNLGNDALRRPLPADPYPPINTNRSYSFITPVIVDNPGFFKSFGQPLDSPALRPHQPGHKVTTRFIGANPRNNLRLEGTFASVERLRSDRRTWETIRTDDDWSLVYRWKRTSTVLGTSEVTIEWDIEDDTEGGTYRLRYFGDAKSIGGKIEAFEGMGGEFTVINGNGDHRLEVETELE